ncbi:HEPN domain-containing protein [Salinicola salarius]|uniref:HEPN domain-containing protein n=1 Tax=Salinicola salarius TaxID=430457 RepID=UPI0013005CB8|nr:HEPN domain-containing protein [Salinicola salarius]
MTSAAKTNFDSHLTQCYEAIEIYSHLKQRGYSADFGLRFVWVSSVSALDHYVSELIIEKSTEQFANQGILSTKLLNEGVPLQASMRMNSSSATQAIVEFRSFIEQVVRFRTFQKSKDIADGLSYIWNEQHKWEKISDKLGLKPKSAKYKLNSIGYRRDLIVHNADCDSYTGKLKECTTTEASEALNYIKETVEIIEDLVP